MYKLKDRKLKPFFIAKVLEQELKEHDWTYEMSDDHSYWTSGTAHRNKIKKMVEDYYAEGEDPADLFYKYYPVDGCHEISGYGIKRTWQEQLDKRAKEMEKA